MPTLRKKPASKRSVAKKPASAGAKAKRGKTVMKKPMKAMKAAPKKRPRSSKPMKAMKAAKKAPKLIVTKELQALKGYVINLERRPDRWTRVSKMLKKEVPWLAVEQFKASDGTKAPIPDTEVAVTWNSQRNGMFGDYFEWVRNDNGQPWKYICDTPDEDDAEWRFKQTSGEEFQYIHDAPTFDQQPVRTGEVENIASGEKFSVTAKFAARIADPGEVYRMAGGERGCAHSHLRLWRLAAEREDPTLALEDDLFLNFDRNGDLGKGNGKVFTKRLALAMKHLPSDFDVLYLGWSGWRGGHFNKMKDDPNEDPVAKKVIRKSEYVWTTIAYVLSQAGAKKLLAAATPVVDQPVDNFMAWEASQGRLNSYVILDEGDDDDTWAGGIVDQFNFQGDSDIKKSDGGIQGDNVKDFLVSS